MQLSSHLQHHMASKSFGMSNQSINRYIRCPWGQLGPNRQEVHVCLTCATPHELQQGVQQHLDAAVASKGRLQQCDCNAAVTDVMPSRYHIVSNEPLCGLIHALQAADIHIRCVIAQLTIHLCSQHSPCCQHGMFFHLQVYVSQQARFHLLWWKCMFSLPSLPVCE